MRRALVIVGKAPEAGLTKTRLTPPLTAEQAASLYGAFLEDTVAMALTLGWEQVSLIYPPRPGAAEKLAAMLPTEVRLSPQPGEGLGAALAAAFMQHLDEGFERVVLIGSDNPTLPASVCREALELLGSHDAVIGPAADGGYYLLGMSRFHPALFQGITWSTEVVLAETFERARTVGITVASVTPWYDVDTTQELERLRSELRHAAPAMAPRTRRMMRDL